MRRHILGPMECLTLCYHAVSESWPAALALPADRLERQVRALLDGGYEPATLADAAGSSMARRTLVVTFDDAYRSTHERALPVLAALGVPATVFVPSDYVGRGRPMAWPGNERWLGGPHERELQCMDAAQLADLVVAGWEIASHTCSHPRLTTLDPPRLEDELTRSKATLEQITQAPCRTIAYPYGDVSEDVAAAARRAGYIAGATLDPRDRSDPLLWPRVGVWRSDSPWRLALKTSRPARRTGLTRLRHPLRRPG